VKSFIRTSHELAAELLFRLTWITLLF